MAFLFRRAWFRSFRFKSRATSTFGAFAQRFRVHRSTGAWHWRRSVQSAGVWVRVLLLWTVFTTKSMALLSTASQVQRARASVHTASPLAFRPSASAFATCSASQVFRVWVSVRLRVV